MADNRYIITKSNYTIKKKHKLLPNDTIYERDYMTTSNLGGWDSGSLPWGEGNFKIIQNNQFNHHRKHRYGQWVLKENCDTPSPSCSGGTYIPSETATTSDCEYFMYDDLQDKINKDNTTNEIIQKHNKNSLLDYVYYGSCKELIQNNIKDIIANYPAELYITNENYTYINRDAQYDILGGSSYYFVENPFNIDIYSQNIPVSKRNAIQYNSLRYFADSFSKYYLHYPDTDYESGYTISNWEVEYREKDCYQDGDKTAIITITTENGISITFTQFYISGLRILMVNDKSLSGISIRPIPQLVEEFFENSDDFINFLLDTDSKPIYTIKIDVPVETNTGLILRRKTLTWPTLHQWNLDVESSNFATYTENLLEIAEWYDENRVDNLWRNMTHDSIKNLDRAYTNNSTDEDIDDYAIGNSRIHQMFNIYGRFFDSIKQSIDNIKSTNEITYNDNNNIPNYFLSDTLQLSGWETKSAILTLKDSITDVLYNGNLKKYTKDDANTIFLKNLKINSKSILSRKGTKESVEMVLALFGLTSYDWGRKRYLSMSENLKPKKGSKTLKWEELKESERSKYYDYRLSEYVNVIENTEKDVVDVDEILPIETYNSYKKDYNSEFNTRTLYGLPVRLVNVLYSTTDESGQTQEVVKKYIIPWFDKTEQLDGNPYFQMFGGWEKTLKKEIVPDRELYPSISSITTRSTFSVYGETKKYLKVVNNISDLEKIDYDDLHDNDIIYVNDIDDYDTYYPSESGITGSTGYTSNYFIIKNKLNREVYGNNGWKNISKAEIFGCPVLTDDGLRVVYLESIIERNDANNPHVGFGQYDDGETYFQYFRQLFKGAIENDLFNDEAYDCETGELLSGITNCGFKMIDNVIDNVKCWYFSDKTQEPIKRLNKIYGTTIEDGSMIQTGYEESETIPTVNVGYKAYKNREVGMSTNLSAFNLENQKRNDNDEAAANSIINSKRLDLTFNDKFYEDDSLINILLIQYYPMLNK